ncbi:MAG TPA: hypothetical protein VFA89_19280 [Terriglobales bacterium]|nr:hypothetical protein [Terriglobales bacterium]
MTFPIFDLLLHDFVAFASNFFQLSTVNDFHGTAIVGYDSCVLQNSSRHRDAGPASTEHLGKKFLRQWQFVRSDPVSAH